MANKFPVLKIAEFKKLLIKLGFSKVSNNSHEKWTKNIQKASYVLNTHDVDQVMHYQWDDLSRVLGITHEELICLSVKHKIVKDKALIKKCTN